MRKPKNIYRAYVAVGFALVVMVGLVAFLLRPKKPESEGGRSGLMLFCAAGMQKPIEALRPEFERLLNAKVEIQYGGSMTLLNQLEVSQVADLYLAADDEYIERAQAKGLVVESIPLADMRPVIVVQKGNPKGIRGVDDLIREDVRVALGSPDQAAIGKAAREALRKSGHWEAVSKHVTRKGVFKPTVPDVANTVEVGSVDAGIVWSATAAQYPDLEVLRAPELDTEASQITIGVTAFSKSATLALQFARFAGAKDHGLKHFAELGYEPVDGDPWARNPEITFFAGSVNRRALEPVIKRFEKREGVIVNTVYNGCGILTAQMRTIRNQGDPGFPDTYMACDVYYLDTVAELFESGTEISETQIVIVVADGNPKKIRSLRDLHRPGVRLAVGQPEQCTIGVLTKFMLEAEGLYEDLIRDNVVTQTASSAMLVPAVTTGAADAVLAYRTDTLAEEKRVDAIPISSPRAKAVQPFAVSRSTEYKLLSARLFAAIRASRDDFESAGFVWRLKKR